MGVLLILLGNIAATNCWKKEKVGQFHCRAFVTDFYHRLWTFVVLLAMKWIDALFEKGESLENQF
jgi:hypothetical protein